MAQEAIPAQAFGRYNRVIEYHDPGTRGLLMKGQDDASGTRDQIVVRAAAFGGPYLASIRESAVAGVIDWKGPGENDTLSWLGPSNRVGPSIGGAAPQSSEIFNRGRIYTNALVNRVQGAAFQGSLGNRKVVVIVDETSPGGGPNGVGSGQWRVYVKVEGRDEDPGVFESANNPGGWKDIGTMPVPSDFAGERWTRQRVWFFNESGTQASAIIPVQDGAITVRRNTFETGLIPSRFPMQIRLMSVDIDAFAETVTFNDEGLEPLQRQDTNTAFSCTRTFPATGRITGTASITTTLALSGTRRIGVDYKGDTRVFARLVASGTRTTVENTTDSRGPTMNDPTNFSGTHLETGGPLANKLVIDGGIAVDVATVDTLVNGNIQDNDGSASGSADVSETIDTAFGLILPTQSVRILKCDLRYDMLIWSSFVQALNPGDGGTPITSSVPATCVDIRTYAATGASLPTRRAVMEGYFLGNKEADFDEQQSNIVPGVQIRYNRVTAVTCCGGGGESFETSSFQEHAVSFESFNHLDDALDLADRASASGVDFFSNGAFSFKTFSGEDVAQGNWFPGGDRFLDFIVNDDLIDVINQVSYDEGPVSTLSGRAAQNSIRAV